MLSNFYVEYAECGEIFESVSAALAMTTKNKQQKREREERAEKKFDLTHIFFEYPRYIQRATESSHICTHT